MKFKIIITIYLILNIISIKNVLTKEMTINEAMKIAIDSGNVTAIIKLVKDGADVNTKISNGYTAIFVIASMGKAEHALLLIKKGADVNAKSKRGTTPLLMAVCDDNYKVAKVLIENGANVNAGRKFTKPLDCAKMKNNKNMIKLLKKHGAVSN